MGYDSAVQLQNQLARLIEQMRKAQAGKQDAHA